MLEEYLEVVTLENAKEYGIMDEIFIGTNHYIYLTNIENEEDFCIRKEVIENDQKYLVGLKDVNEFNIALKAFAEKHK